MKEQLDLLFELQQIDTRIDDASKRLAGLDDGSRKRDELGKERGRLAEMEEKLEKTSGEQLDRELELESTEDERKQKWSQAYGGTISDPKELAALEKKIEELARRKDKLENVLLELYDNSEAQTRQVEAQRDLVARLEQELAATADDFERTSGELRDAIAEATRQRAALTGKLDEKLLADYEDVRAKNAGLAVVAVSGNMCTGCRVSVSTMILEQLQRGAKVVRCENCRRILHQG